MAGAHIPVAPEDTQQQATRPETEQPELELGTPKGMQASTG